MPDDLLENHSETISARTSGDPASTDRNAADSKSRNARLIAAPAAP
jgi:hypothetical protein